MKKAVIVTNGIVTRVLSADVTDWETKGVPDGCLLADSKADIEVGDYVSDRGKVDTLGRVKEAKKKEITMTRYDRETSGTVIQDMNIATDRESQALITGAALQATVDKDYTCKWKTQSGFVTLTAQQILAIAGAVRAHVQACFDREAELLGDVVKAKTKEAIEAIRWDSE